MAHTTFIVMFDHSNTKKKIGKMQSIGCPRKNERPGISLTSSSILIRFGEVFKKKDSSYCPLYKILHLTFHLH